MATRVSVRVGSMWMRPARAYQATASGTDPSRSCGEGGAFVGVGLADVVVEGDSEVGLAGEDGGEGAAGADGVELVGVADEHDGGVGAFGGEEESGEVGVGGHAGFVDDDHGAVRRG